MTSRKPYRDTLYDVDMEPSEMLDEDDLPRRRSGNGMRHTQPYRDEPEEEAERFNDDSVRGSAMESARRFLWDEDDDNDETANINLNTHAANPRRDSGDGMHLLNPSYSVTTTNLSGNPERDTSGGIMGIFQRSQDAPSFFFETDAANSADDDMEEYFNFSNKKRRGGCLNRRRNRWVAIFWVLVISIFAFSIHRHNRKEDVTVTDKAGSDGIPAEGDSWINHIKNRQRFDDALEQLATFTYQRATKDDKAMEWIVQNDDVDTQDDQFKHRYLLASIYFNTGGQDSWEKASSDVDWLSEEHICDWHGISCDNLKKPHTLNLTRVGCTGVIPLQIVDLNLVTVDLSFNSLDGTIPAHLEKSNLVNIYLRDNLLVGTIPVHVSRIATLRRLSLQNNRLSGNIPYELSMIHPPDILEIDLGGNNLVGTIPDFSNYKDIELLYLDRNELTGGIRDNIGALSMLQELRLNQNKLGGTIPRSVAIMSQLRVMDLSQNKIGGAIPSILAGLYRLEELYLYDNQLTGNIPSLLFQNQNHFLRILALNDNRLTGGISGGIQNLIVLQQLRLDDNEMAGSLPLSIARMSTLTDLRLSENSFAGPIPSELGSMVKLDTLHLDMNEFNGFIPSQLGDLKALTSLRLHGNMLTGSMPSEVCSIEPMEYMSANCNAQHKDGQTPYVECACCTRCF